MPTDISTEERQDDFLTQVQRHIANDEVGLAIDQIFMLDDESQRLNILSNLLPDINANLPIKYDLSIVSNLVTATAYAIDLDKNLALNLMQKIDKVLSFVLTRNRNLTGGLKSSQRTSRVIMRILEYIQGLIYLKFINVKELSPQRLNTQLTPYITAIGTLQEVINEANDVDAEIRVREISQNSPWSALIEGIGNAYSALREDVVPWRRRNAELLSNFQVEKEKAETIKARVDVAKAKHEYREMLKESQDSIADEKERLELERMRIENQQMLAQFRKQLMQDNFELAEQIFEKFAPNVSDEKKIALMPRLLKSLDTLMTSPLELDTGETDNDEDA